MSASSYGSRQGTRSGGPLLCVRLIGILIARPSWSTRLMLLPLLEGTEELFRPACVQAWGPSDGHHGGSPRPRGRFYDIPGAPRCPCTVIDATAALAWRRTEGWGPAQMAMEQRDCWGAAVAWAGAPRAALALPGPLAMLRRERAAITAAADAAADVRALRLPVPLARALYCGLWADRWERKAEAWLLRRSAGRRWLPTGGEEWRLLPAAGTYGPAFHVLRALCGGLRGPAGARSVVVRDGRPWCCSVCAASGARWAWRTPGPTVPGLAFLR